MRGRPAVIALLSAALILSACEVITPARGTVSILASSSPTCPVETTPPDPECAPRPVAGATVRIERVDGGGVVAEGRTDAEGRLSLEVPAGDYVVVAAPVEGLLAPPPPLAVSVAADQVVVANLPYDTGIR
jgi:hypothetical protein